jgi:mannan endo-1,4-beta-mannosidase
MKSRLVVAVAMALALASVTGAVSRVVSSAPSKPPAAHAALPPGLAAYLGAFEPGAPPDYAPVASFAQAAGQVPNLIGYYSGWAEPFNVTFANTLRNHGIIPFVQIDPTDASVSAIAGGTYDEYLRSYADSVRNFKDAVVIGFGHEMNANWYSWGYGHVAPSKFIAAWKHLVTVFRQQGADNVTWLWTVQADGPHTGPVQDWWPGASYVTWVGVDGYYYRPTDTFSSVFGKTIDQVRTFTKAPVLLSETAVGPAADPFPKIQDLFHGVTSYHTLGLVWFDMKQKGDLYHQDWRLEDNGLAKESFQLGVKDDITPVTPTG